MYRAIILLLSAATVLAVNIEPASKIAEVERVFKSTTGVAASSDVPVNNPGSSMFE